MVAGTLYTYPENFRAYKALIAAQYSGAKVKVADDFVFGETNKSATFLKKFPTGKVPAFETEDGKYLVESNAIAYYLANTQLRGTDDYSQAQVQQWINFADSEILPASCAWVFPLLGIMPYDKNAVKRAKNDVTTALRILNKKLSHSTYLVGEGVTLADIILFCNLLHLYQFVLEAPIRTSFRAVTRWFTTILNQPQVKAVIKDFTVCTKALEFDAEKYENFTKAHAVPEKKPKDEKKQKPTPQPAEPAAASEAAEDENEFAEPKSTDPFDALEKGTFVIDSFKRCYSNKDEAESIQFFWDKFDPKNYSIWYGEYKYNSELTKVFMSCNLITGMFQRLDKMRKQAFASVCLFGEDNNCSISGIWVWRGQDLAFKLSKDWQVDYDCYEWKKLEPDSDETKKLVEQYFSWTGTDKQGRKFNQGKIFK